MSDICIFDRETINRELAPFQSQIVDDNKARFALAQARQARIGQANRAIQRKHIDGLGEVTANIDSHLYHVIGHAVGYEAFNDAQFMRELLRDNEDMRVQSGSGKIQVGYTPGYQGFSQ